MQRLILNLEFFSMAGSVLVSGNLSTGRISLSEFNSGPYMLEVSDQNTVRKIIIIRQ
jgi:hypothetical protein